jgi:hypothetical protein
MITNIRGLFGRICEQIEESFLVWGCKESLLEEMTCIYGTEKLIGMRGYG